MRLYYVCEYCEEIFSVEENGSAPGQAEIRGICSECALEMGLQEVPTLHSRLYYH